MLFVIVLHQLHIPGSERLAPQYALPAGWECVTSKQTGTAAPLFANNHSHNHCMLAGGGPKRSSQIGSGREFSGNEKEEADAIPFASFRSLSESDFKLSRSKRERET